MCVFECGSFPYNSEVWHSLTKGDIFKLEVIDHQVMRAICYAHSKTPVEFLYLETSASQSH